MVICKGMTKYGSNSYLKLFNEQYIKDVISYGYFISVDSGDTCYTTYTNFSSFIIITTDMNILYKTNTVLYHATDKFICDTHSK